MNPYSQPVPLNHNLYPTRFEFTPEKENHINTDVVKNIQQNSTNRDRNLSQKMTQNKDEFRNKEPIFNSQNTSQVILNNASKVQPQQQTSVIIQNPIQQSTSVPHNIISSNMHHHHPNQRVIIHQQPQHVVKSQIPITTHVMSPGNTKTVSFGQGVQQTQQGSNATSNIDNVELIRTQANRIQHLEDRIEVITSEFKRLKGDLEFRCKEVDSWQQGYEQLQNQLNLHMERVREQDANIEDLKQENEKLILACSTREKELKDLQSNLKEKNQESQFWRKQSNEIENDKQQGIKYQNQIKLLELENQRLINELNLRNQQPTLHQNLHHSHQNIHTSQNMGYSPYHGQTIIAQHPHTIIDHAPISTQQQQPHIFHQQYPNYSQNQNVPLQYGNEGHQKYQQQDMTPQNDNNNTQTIRFNRFGGEGQNQNSIDNKYQYHYN